MQQGHDKVVAVLLENDSRGKVRLPALHIAAKKDDVKAAKLLLDVSFSWPWETVIPVEMRSLFNLLSLADKTKEFTLNVWHNMPVSRQGRLALKMLRVVCHSRGL